MGEKTQERRDLEARAEALKIKYPANIGDDKLLARIKKAEAAGATDQSNPVLADGAPLRLYPVIEHLRRDGKTYAPGDEIELDAETALDLAELDCVALPDPDDD